MVREKFGTDGYGNSVDLVTLSNKNGTKVKISTLGATVVSFLFQDKTGVLRDVVLGYDTAEDYLNNNGLYFGASVGRCANRISGAAVVIDGVEYALEANNGSNNLHSGSNGISYKIWDIEHMDEEENCLTLKIVSADLEQGFPGNMTIRAVYTLTDDDALHIVYQAVSDKNTIANFTNHSYFNLAGHDSGDIGRQKLKIYAESFTPLASEGSVPTGEICSIKGTPFDFTELKEIGREIESSDNQIIYARGYDHNFVLDNQGKLKLMAEAVCAETGICLYAYTDRPGVQLYTGNFIHEHTGKQGAHYGMRHGFCLESQYYPDAFRHPNFQKPLLKAGEDYQAHTVFQLKLQEN